MVSIKENKEVKAKTHNRTIGPKMQVAYKRPNKDSRMKEVVHPNCPKDSGGSTFKRSLISGRTIAGMADQLGLVPTTTNRANELYEKVKNTHALRSKLHEAMAGCLYIVCREVGKPHTYKEISSVAANGVSKKGIGHAVKGILKKLEEKGEPVDMGEYPVAEFIMRFCSKLGMENDVLEATKGVVKSSDQLHLTRQNPLSVIAASIFMASQLSVDKNQLKDVAQATSVGETTILTAYKCLYPHATQLIPDWFAKKEDVLRKLYAP